MRPLSNTSICCLLPLWVLPFGRGLLGLGCLAALLGPGWAAERLANFLGAALLNSELKRLKL